MALGHGYGTELRHENQTKNEHSRPSELHIQSILHSQPTSQEAITFNETIVFEFVRGLGVEGEKNFMALFLLIIPVMTIFGNLLVVISVYRERTLRTATNYLIISMAMADLLVALCVMPFAVYVEVQNGLWKLPKSLCTCYTAIDVCASTASILNLVAISWDRYMAVSKPIEYSQCRHRKNRRVFTMITVVWFIAIAIALPMVTGLNRLDETPYCEFTNALYIIASSFASFFLPCLIMVGLYGVVLRKLRERQEQRTRSTQNSRCVSRGRSVAKRHASASTIAYGTPTVEKSMSCVGLGLNRGTVSHRPDIEHDRDTIFATNLLRPFENRVSNPEITESGLTTMAPSPRIITSSTAVTAPASASPFRRQSGRLSQRIPRSGHDIERENNNNLILPMRTMELERRSSPAPDDMILGKSTQLTRPFGLFDIDSESVPFIDASSLQATPSQRRKITTQPPATSMCCNGGLKRLPASASSTSSVFPLVKANSISVIGQPPMTPQPLHRPRHETWDTSATSPLPRKRRHESIDKPESRSRTLSSEETRRHSIANFVNGSLWPMAFGFRFRDSSCFAEMLDMQRRRAASCSAVAAVAAAKYSRQSRKERRATHTLAVVLVVFLCCWLPFFTCHMTNSICMVRSGDTCVPIVAFFFTTWLGYTNSFMNPVIYTLFNPEYRRAFKNILCCQTSAHHRC